MKAELFIDKYWNYYLLLEKKVLDLQKYIEFDTYNYKTYSLEIQNLLISTCCEVEVLMKLICNKSGKSDMNEYRSFIKNDDYYKKMINEKVSLVDFGRMAFRPLRNFKDDKSLEWWTSYNGIKHDRMFEANYQKANLKNLLQSLSCLYLLEIYYYKKVYYESGESDLNIPYSKSCLFESKFLKPNFGVPFGIIEGNTFTKFTTQ